MMGMFSETQDEAIGELELEIKKLTEQNSIYREALDYYAKKENYEYYDRTPYGDESTHVDIDGGDKAKEAIAKADKG